MMVQGRLSIERSNVNGQIFITVENKETGNRIIQIEISPEHFANAITGLGCQPCSYQAYRGAIKEE
jgi:hypothetical protein